MNQRKHKTKTTSKKPRSKKQTPSGEQEFSMQSPLRTYRTLQKEVEKTWHQLREDVKKRDRDSIMKRRDDLLYLLGECNYMIKECSRCLEESHDRNAPQW